MQGKITGKIINFFVDNQSALHTLKCTKLNGLIKVDVVETINNFVKESSLRIIFNWVKSHNDCTGNELADCLAKCGTESTNIINVPPGYSYIRSTIANRISVEWDKFWLALPSCRQSKELITYRPSKKEALFITSKSRSQCRRLISLMTGHNLLRYHLFNQYVPDHPDYSPCCRLCGEQVETSWHLLMDCPSLESKRRESIYNPGNPKRGPDIEQTWRLASNLGLLDLVLNPSQCLTETSDSE